MASRMPDQKLRLYAIIGVTLAVLWMSPDALFIRLYDDLGGYQQIFWRFYRSLLCLSICFASYYRSRTLDVIKATNVYYMVGGGILNALVNVFFTLSVEKTAAATSLVLLSSTPIWAALSSRLFFERENTSQHLTRHYIWTCGRHHSVCWVTLSPIVPRKEVMT